MEMVDLSQEQYVSVRRSYFNILGLFLEKEYFESRFIRCLLKWGFQLHLTPNDLKIENLDISTIAFRLPNTVERLEAIYHLVYMIYLDKVVEDVELEVAALYAQKLGFKATVVTDLFKSIATAIYDEDDPKNVRREVLDFLKVYDSAE